MRPPDEVLAHLDAKESHWAEVWHRFLRRRVRHLVGRPVSEELAETVRAIQSIALVHYLEMRKRRDPGVRLEIIHRGGGFIPGRG